eukprot:jgi/Ulvmu1/9374/UM051_0001.1
MSLGTQGQVFQGPTCTLYISARDAVYRDRRLASFKRTIGKDQRAKILEWVEVLQAWRDVRPDFEEIVGYACSTMTPGRLALLPTHPSLRYSWRSEPEQLYHLCSTEWLVVWRARLRVVERDEFEKLRRLTFTLLEFFSMLEQRERLLGGRDALDLYEELQLSVPDLFYRFEEYARLPEYDEEWERLYEPRHHVE